MGLRLLAGPTAIPADLLARLAGAEQMAHDAKHEAESAKADAIAADGRAEAARLEAVKAEATGQNARQMVISRDPKLNAVAEQYDTLEELAASYSAALSASVADRAAIHAELATLTARVTGHDSNLAALQSAVAALQALKVMVAFGTATLSGSLLAGASRDVTVPLSRDMGSATYSVGSSLSGGTSLLGQLVHDGITAQTRTSVTVRVRNTGLTSIANLSAAVVHVVGAREA